MVDHNKQKRIDEIFCKACEIPKSQLDEFLDDVCGDDLEIRSQVEKLLAADHDLQSDEQILANQPIGGVCQEMPKAAGGTLDEEREIKAGAADRNLLYGIVALQLNFINRDALIQAMNTWVLNKTKPIENILVSNGDMGENTQLLLGALVDKHLEHHDEDPAKSLATLSATGIIKHELEEINDEELEQSLANLKSDSSSFIPDSPTVDFIDPSKHGGRFRVLRPHRKGGLGAVSVARDEELNRDVALKEVLKKHAHNKSARDRLVVEAEITGGLEHPGIVPVYGLGVYQDGNPFYCMRFIKGDSLKDAIRNYQNEKASLSTSERNLRLRGLLRRFIDVCEAVAYAHSRSVLHRDLKPGNIMLGKYGETLVVDWGLAKATGREPIEELSLTADRPLVPRSGSTGAPTMPGTAIGTPQYMSPEQAEGQLDQLGPATDVYSLGATMYCLLAGQAPVTDKEPEDAMRKVRDGDFPMPRTIDNSIPKPLEAICLKAMALSPSDRYLNAINLAEDVENWLGDEQVTAFREPAWSQCFRIMRKNRTAAASISVAAVVAIIGLTGMNLISQSKNRQIQQKNEVIRLRNEELLALNQQLTESKNTLERNYASFRSLTARLVKQAENELSQRPEWEPIRNWLTHEILLVVQQFQNENPDTSWLNDSSDSKLWLAELYRYEANVNRNNNLLEESIENYESAVQIYRNILQESPGNPKGRGFLAETLADYANTIVNRDGLDKARRLVDEAIEISHSLLTQYPDKPNSKRLHAWNLLDSAAIDRELVGTEKALSQIESSLDLYSEIAKLDRLRDRDFLVLAMAYLQKSTYLRGSMDFPDAAKSIDEAILRSRNPSQITNYRERRQILARCLLEKVQLQNAIGNENETNQELIEQIEESVKLLEELTADFPEFLSYKKFLALAYVEHGKILASAEKAQSSGEQYEMALSTANSIATSRQNESLFHELMGDVTLAYSRYTFKNDNRERSLGLSNESVNHFKDACAIKPKSKTLRLKHDEASEFTEVIGRNSN